MQIKRKNIKIFLKKIIEQVIDSEKKIEFN